MLLAARFAAKTSDFYVEIAEVSMKFGADFARDTRPAPSEIVQTLRACAARRVRRVCCFCARGLRVERSFGTEVAQIRR